MSINLNSVEILGLNPGQVAYLTDLKLGFEILERKNFNARKNILELISLMRAAILCSDEKIQNLLDAFVSSLNSDQSSFFASQSILLTPEQVVSYDALTEPNHFIIYRGAREQIERVVTVSSDTKYVYRGQEYEKSESTEKQSRKKESARYYRGVLIKD
ncbi:hypothetical protein [Bacterioplanoides sp.]|uniref:hypothetical protein n=1 Tax=Bacterioplanoides sp. TaxID=2066072 RepID=UPI003B0079B7